MPAEISLSSQIFLARQMLPEADSFMLPKETNGTGLVPYLLFKFSNLKAVSWLFLKCLMNTKKEMQK